MTNRIMAVYDVDPFYADRFADFVNQKEKDIHLLLVIFPRRTWKDTLTKQ